MEKKLLEEFICRFFLAGSIERAVLKYDPDEKKLICAAGVLPNKNLLARVDMPFTEWDNKYDTEMDFPFYDISKLKKALAPFGKESINVDIATHKDKPVALTFADDYSEARCILCDPSVVGIKFWKTQSLPEFHVELEEDDEFIPRYLKACGSLKGENKGFDTLFTLINKNGKLDLVINYSSSANTNRHCIHLKAKSGDLERQLTFNSEHLKNILNENMGAEVSKIEISNLGFIKLSFQYKEMSSLYILTAVKVGK